MNDVNERSKIFILLKRVIFYPIAFLSFVPFFLVTMVLGLCVRSRVPSSSKNARLVWGPSPIINNKYWSNSMKAAGYKSQTFMMMYSASINKQNDYDEYVHARYPSLPYIIRLPILFWESLFRFDVFFLSYDGWILGTTFLTRWEPFFLRWAGKKIVVIPYGGDAYVYKNIRSATLLHGLMMSYPQCALIQDRIEKKVNLWTRNAHCANPGVMGMDGIGRWDVLRPSSLCIDTDKWKPRETFSGYNGKDGPVYVVHAPNHTGFKGTEFFLHAIDILKNEGLDVRLILLQGVQNDEVCRIFHEEADILLEQLICTGHGINAVEGMSSGLPVVSNLEDETYTRIFRRWSFLNECPIASATPENIVDVLRKLVTEPELRAVLGAAGRQYVEKYFAYDSSVHLFENILQYIYGEKDSIINLYHPLTSDYNKRLPPVNHPLIENRIQD